MLDGGVMTTESNDSNEPFEAVIRETVPHQQLHVRNPSLPICALRCNQGNQGNQLTARLARVPHAGHEYLTHTIISAS